MKMNKMIHNAIMYGMIMLATCLVGCSDDDPSDLGHDSDKGQLLPQHSDPRLVGSWKFVKSLGDGSGYKTVLHLNEDGTGSDHSGNLKWFIANNKLQIVFADGSILRTAYRIEGAVLTVEDYAEYEMELPFLGSWTAANAGKSFTGTDFFYHFDRDGEGGVFTFGSDGIWKYQERKWSRTQEGIEWMKGKNKEHLSYQVSENTLTIEGKGAFVQTPPYYGVWKSVSSSSGAIEPDDHAFSTVEIYKYQEKTYFYCQFWDKSNLDGTYHKSNYQAFTKVVFSKQQQMIILLPEGLEEGTAVYFRFYQSKESSKVFMDLSKNVEFKEYVRYEYQKQK